MRTSIMVFTHFIEVYKENVLGGTRCGWPIPMDELWWELAGTELVGDTTIAIFKIKYK